MQSICIHFIYFGRIKCMHRENVSFVKICHNHQMDCIKSRARIRIEKCTHANALPLFGDFSMDN